MDIENRELCRECGGRCCNLSPGILYPEDFEKVSAESIAALLRTGFYVIDTFDYMKIDEKERPGYHIRPHIYFKPIGDYRILSGLSLGFMNRHIGTSVLHRGWGGPCIFLEENGCRLSLEERPKQCRVLDPTTCHEPGGENPKYLASLAWAPYEKEIEEAIEILLPGLKPEVWSSFEYGAQFQ
jgi:Fe-S-cluster containining protein